MKVGQSFSDTLSVTSGVPQGSVLGPILFNIFINDIVNCVNDDCEIFLFADDVKLFSSQHQSLQDTLNQIGDWSKRWQLNISIEKCFILHLGRNNPEMAYYLDGLKLQPSNSVKDLGVFTTNSLSSTIQCNEIYKKCSRISSLICKTFLSRNQDLILKAYKTYVLPILDYCSPVYNPYKISDIKMLERTQRKFTKRLLHNGLSYSDRLSCLNLETLEQRRLKSDLILAYKIIHNRIPSLSHLLRFQEHDRFTRTSLKPQLEIQRFSLDIKKNFFVNRVSHVLNLFPVNAWFLERYDLEKFKRNLDNTDLRQFLRGAAT